MDGAPGSAQDESGKARAVWMKRVRSAGSLRPGEDSMPLETSTPQGLSWAIAWATFSRIEAAGDDQMHAAGRRGEEGARGCPVEGHAGASHGRAHLRVDQDAVGEIQAGRCARSGLRAERRGILLRGWRVMRRRLADWPVQGLDDSHAACEAFREPLGQRLIETAVKLHRGQAGLVRDGCDLPGVARVEDSDALDVGRKVRSDCRHLCGRHLARAGAKTKPTASAPSWAARDASSRLVLPQIFTHMASASSPLARAGW